MGRMQCGLGFAGHAPAGVGGGLDSGAPQCAQWLQLGSRARRHAAQVSISAAPHRGQKAYPRLTRAPQVAQGWSRGSRRRK
jgi:hypothetical protein